MSIEIHCTTNCNITTNICVTTYNSLYVVNLLLVAQNGLSRNELIEPHLFRENSIADLLVCSLRMKERKNKLPNRIVHYEQIHYH